MITSKNELIKYIRLMLGEPRIKIDIDDSQIGVIINDTVQKFTNVAYGDTETTQIIQHKDLHDYKIKLLTFSDVTRVQSTDARYMYNYHWDSMRRILTLQDADIAEKYLVVGMASYVQDDDEDLVFNQEWVRKYAKAQTKFLWGNILGKYSGTLVGGAEANYDRIISEAQDEIQQLEEELKEKWIDPAPIFVTNN